MNDCVTCGRKIVFRAMPIKVNRKRGVAHWLENREGEQCPCLKDWAWAHWKYPRVIPSISTVKIDAWNAANPGVTAPERVGGNGREE